MAARKLMEVLERVGANFPALDGDKYVSITAKVGSVGECVCVWVYHSSWYSRASSQSFSQ